MGNEMVKKFVQLTNSPELENILTIIEGEFPKPAYDLSKLFRQFQLFYKKNMTAADANQMLIRACIELTSKEEPKWEYIAARFLSNQIKKQVTAYFQEQSANNNATSYLQENQGAKQAILDSEEKPVKTYYDRVVYYTEQGYYGAYLLETYKKEEIEELEAYIQEERNNLFTYSGLDLLAKRYLLQDNDHQIIEHIQEMFMSIAMHLALHEKERVHYAKQFYDVLSTLKVTMATPTMANARKPYHQMSSCFIDTVDDDLKAIYKSLDHFAQVSKFGGGMGMYFGKVRANGSDIRGYKNAAGGVIRWMKLVNDTAVAVDQLGVRSGAVAVYLDAWHKDLPEFLQIRTNNGDDRMKAHDIFPAVCYPNLFWEVAKKDLNSPWYFMCPHEVQTIKGYALEDSYGAEWEEKYWDCVQDDRIPKREMPIKEVVRLVLKSAVETGTPFVFNRDLVNEMNPNKHKGMIYSSNLCTEIAQNMSPTRKIQEEILEVNGNPVIVDKYESGDFVVCNLASLVLGNINVNDPQELRSVIRTTVRALDNVIDLNYYPLPYAKITNQRYRSIGLGTSGYHHMLVKNNLRFESEEHLQFVDQLYENINYYTLEASHDLAKEKGAYSYFQGSDYETGEYFRLRGYAGEHWEKLEEAVKKDGIRNAYLMAVAPTSSTSVIAGTTAAVDPILNKYYMEEKKGMMMTRVAPDLNMQTFWLYKNAHYMDQNWLIKAAGVRQRHIDQAQSLNLYITNEYTFKQVLQLYIKAYEEGVKTIYYVRSKSLEIEECDSCSA